jgi:predicted O-methyltransferase YrrM
VLTAEGQVKRAEQEGWRYDGSMTSEGEVIDLIHALVLAVKPDVMVETGTFTGHATKSISAAMTRNGRGTLFTVENDPGLAAKYAEFDLPYTVFVNADSAEWCSSEECPERVDIGFVDSGPPSVRLEDAKGLYPRIPDGGLLIAHDVVFYEDEYFPFLKDMLGAPQLFLPTLNGLAIWQM